MIARELAPSAGMLPESTVRVIFAASAAKITLIDSVTALDVQVTFAGPGVAAAIKEMVIDPESSRVATVWLVLPLGKVPRVVEKVTEVPLGTG